MLYEFMWYLFKYTNIWLILKYFPNLLTCLWYILMKNHYCFCSVAQACLTLCKPMGCSTPGFPIFHHLLELPQIRIHWVGDALQPSCPLLSPSSPAVLLGSLTLLLSTQVPFPNKISCFVSTCVSSDNSFPSIRQEPSFRPWKGSPFLQHYH